MLNVKSNKNDFLEQTKAAREERLAEKVRDSSCVCIQSVVRGWLVRVKVKKKIEQEFDKAFPPLESNASTVVPACPSLKAYKIAKRFIYFIGCETDNIRFERMIRYLVASLDSESPATSYIGVFLNKEHSVAWIKHVKFIMTQVSCLVSGLALDSPSDGRRAANLILALISFTSTNTWRMLKKDTMKPLVPGMNNLVSNMTGHLVQHGLLKNLRHLLLQGLAQAKVTMTVTTLAAVSTLAIRPLIYASFTNNAMSLYLIHIFSVPGLVHHLVQMCPDSLNQLKTSNLLTHAVKLLAQDQQLKIHFNALEGSYALCLTANIIHLVSLETESGLDDSAMMDLVSVLARLLDSCGQYVTAKQSNLSHWHPVLGWFSVSLDKYLQAAMPYVRQQLSRLWLPDCLKLLTIHLHSAAQKIPPLPAPPPPPVAEQTNSAKQLFKKALEKTKNTGANFTPAKPSLNKLGNSDCTKIAMVCTLFQTAIKTLSELRLEILTGLCYQDILLKPLWIFLSSLGTGFGLKSFIDLLGNNPKATAPEFQMLMLFCDTGSHLVTVLDDVEFYEGGKPFLLHEYASMGTFLNQFLYKAVSSGLVLDTHSLLFSSLSGFLAALRRRDDRRPFTQPNHWLVRDVKVGSLLSDLEKGKPAAKLIIQKLPHIIPHQDRVVLFRKKVQSEKSSLGLLDNDSGSPQSTLVTIHRNRIVEDGYRQLSSISSLSIKGVIRVKFINLQGLDEAGIDQDGVFKEFLEESIKKVFDPGLNLFCSTSEERLYPSPLSHLTDNHLDLFEFVGKMIGKAVYEGIVIDVPFASFFLTQILGKDHAAFYSYVDELASLDPELYRNLTYMKHYEGNVADLDLTFSFDQDMMGQIKTHELVPGGKSIPVTNSNRISYIHHIAHYRMHYQIRHQTAAFNRGFRSVIASEWLNLFSCPEVQRLISGDNSPLDLKDLRRNTSYYGGFHDSHRVVVWLWDILEKDFSDKEKGSFLKFVTSCSKPPLLGFENLEPPFSIRCVEVSDEDDDGDTVGSVLRGFLALGRRDPVNRLPTASTCFNLLKLPNYQKKNTLREKLRYAISCNSGFELS